MKQNLKLFIFLLLLSPLARADHSEHKMPPDTSSKEFKMIKALEGKWVTTTDMFGKKERLYVNYKVTAGGSTVVETIFPGTPYEMMSVYYDDKGKLAMTHYCMLRNRPTFKMSASTEDSISLKVLKVEGLKLKNLPSMGDLTFVFKDKNRMVQTCFSKDEKGKVVPMSLEYTRVK